LGAILARCRPGGMARVMITTAGAQVLAFAVALIAWRAFTDPLTVFWGFVSPLADAD
jgi:hypothetical protein